MSPSATPAKQIIADKPIAWVLAIIVPFILYYYLTHLGFAREPSIFLAIVSVTLICWMFSLMADFIPALMALLMILLFGLAPDEIVLSGFSSNGFIIAFSVMGLGAIINSSGLAQRYTLWLLNTIPANTIFYQLAVFFTGFLLNPVVPTITGRAVIVGPILNNIVSSCDENSRERSSSLLYLSGLDGINYLSPIFLTAAPANLMVFALLPPQEQYSFNFIFWFYAASVTGTIMLLAYFVTSTLFFRSFHKVTVSKEEIKEQWLALEKYSWLEWSALSGISFLVIGIMTTSLHKIPLQVISLSVICSLLVLGALSRDDFVKKIDWAFLFLLASMIGIMSCMSYMGLDKNLIDQLGWLEHSMRHNFPLFVLALSCAILLIRLFIPLNAAILIFAAALLPLASGAGISPWVVGFIILIMSETAFFGYQSPYILLFRNLVKDHVSHSERKVQLFHGMLIFVKLGAIYASIPFWRAIGVL